MVSDPQAPPSPRLFDMKAAAEYLHVSEFTARDWARQGFFPIVELPPRRPREGARQKRAFRRLLVDREDLDRFIEARKRTLSELLGVLDQGIRVTSRYLEGHRALRQARRFRRGHSEARGRVSQWEVSTREKGRSTSG